MFKHISRRLMILALIVFSAVSSMAQTAGSSFDETMRSNNKIYVVMAVCLVILITFIIYLIRIDRKISKLEDR